MAAKAPEPANEAPLSAGEAGAVFAPALGVTGERARLLLTALRHQPPQLLHLEGGAEQVRVALALWWAALLNCNHSGMDGTPCLDCPDCLRIGANLAADCIVLDGRTGSIKIDTIRALRPLLGEPPRFGRMRLILVVEAQALGVEAANALLKSLEEPCPGTCFAFTAPQRERLLPTLVSRGWTLTLPWPDPARPPEGEAAMWRNALAEFLRTGQGWFGKTSVRGALDAASAQHVVLAGQQALADGLAGREQDALARCFGAGSAEALARADEVFARCQDVIHAQVNPALVLDTMAPSLWHFSPPGFAQPVIMVTKKAPRVLASGGLVFRPVCLFP